MENNLETWEVVVFDTVFDTLEENEEYVYTLQVPSGTSQDLVDLAIDGLLARNGWSFPLGGGYDKKTRRVA